MVVGVAVGVLVVAVVVVVVVVVEMAPASQPTWEQGCLHIGTNRPLSQNQQMPRWPQPASQHGTKAASI